MQIAWLSVKIVIVVLRLCHSRQHNLCAVCAIRFTFYHCSSLPDEKASHNKGPKGRVSWCNYEAAKPGKLRLNTSVKHFHYHCNLLMIYNNQYQPVSTINLTNTFILFWTKPSVDTDNESAKIIIPSLQGAGKKAI